MFVPFYILIPAALLLLVLILRLLAGGHQREMIDGQRQEGFEPGSDHLTVLAQADVHDAIAKGRKIEAVRLVRERTGLGLKESKQLVERRMPR